MEMIDNYSRFLEPDEIETFSKNKMTAYLAAKSSGRHHQSIIYVEIYKCPHCGLYRGVEHFKEEREGFTLISDPDTQAINVFCHDHMNVKHDPGLDKKCMGI